MEKITQALQSAAVATGNGNTLDCKELATLVVQVTGITTATITFEANVDETNWVAIRGVNVNSGSIGSTTAADGLFRFDVSSYNQFRARISAWTAGTITALASGTDVAPGANNLVSSAVQGAVADGSASTDNPVIMGTVDSNGDVQALLGSTTGRLFAAVNAAASDGSSNTLAHILSATPQSGGVLNIASNTFNGTTWDRLRGNEEGTVLTSAARTAQTDSSDITTYNARGVLLVVNISLDPSTAAITPSLQVKDPVSSNYATIWTAAAALNGTGTFTYLLYPGVIAADFDGTEAVSFGIPRTWRFRMTVADAESMTYSVGATYLV